MRPLSIAWLQDIGHDARFAVRTALKDRSFTAVAVATLALSIGLNATLFTIVSGMDNVPAVEHPERLVSVRSVDGAGRPLAPRTRTSAIGSAPQRASMRCRRRRPPR